MADLPSAQRAAAKDGEKFLELGKLADGKDFVVELGELQKIQLVQSGSPVVKLFDDADADAAKAELQFACDTGITLFRNALRQAFWGLGSFRSVLTRWDR